MTDIDAKRILYAFARMVGFDGVARYSYDKGIATSYHVLQLTRDGYSVVIIQETVDAIPKTTHSIAKFSKYNWSSILEEFVNKTIAIPYHTYGWKSRFVKWNYKEYKFTSVEELAIKLQLEGWLKPL